MYETLIDAWGDADLTDDAQNAGESVPENHLLKSVVDAIASWPVDQIRNRAARLLAYGDAGTHPTHGTSTRQRANWLPPCGPTVK